MRINLGEIHRVGSSQVAERPRRQHRDQPGLAAATIKHLTAQVQAVDTADELHRRHHLLLSGVGVSETRAT
jgi:hypothetical protein